MLLLNFKVAYYFVVYAVFKDNIPGISLPTIFISFFYVKLFWHHMDKYWISIGDKAFYMFVKRIAYLCVVSKVAIILKKLWWLPYQNVCHIRNLTWNKIVSCFVILSNNRIILTLFQETNRLEFLIPKKTSLQHRLRTGGDQGFIDFVAFLLEINPKKRPSASAALRHPWLSFPYEPISSWTVFTDEFIMLLENVFIYLISTC